MPFARADFIPLSTAHAILGLTPGQSALVDRFYWTPTRIESVSQFEYVPRSELDEILKDAPYEPSAFRQHVDDILSRGIASVRECIRFDNALSTDRQKEN